MPDPVILNHTDYIKIHNLDGDKTEVFEGIGMSVSTSGGNGGGNMPTSPTGTPVTPYEPTITPVTTGGTPVTQAEKKAFDVNAAWSAQQKLTGTLIKFLSSLDPGLNTDFSNILVDYIHLLEATKSFTASTDAFDISNKAISELPIIWKTIDREPSKEMGKIINDGATLGDDLEAWYKIAVKANDDLKKARQQLREAEQQLENAATEGEVTAANAAITAANAAITAANAEMAAAATMGGDANRGMTRDGETGLPVKSVAQKLVALILITRAIATQNWLDVGILLIRIFIPILIDFIVDWVMKKIGNDPETDLEPISKDIDKVVNALRDIALQEKTISFGDNASLHTKAEVLVF